MGPGLIFCQPTSPTSCNFFLIRVFFHGHWRLTGDSRGREGTIFYSTLPFPPAHKHSDIYLKLCMWDDYHIFLITPLVLTATRQDLQTYRITIWLIDDVMLTVVCLLADFILRFCYVYLTWETGRLEFASTIILVLQAKRLSNSAFSQNPCTFFQFSWKGSKDLPELLPLVRCL